MICSVRGLRMRWVARPASYGQAAQHGISTAGSSIYVTLEPCISCLKLVMAAGIRQVFYEDPFVKDEKADLRDFFVRKVLSISASCLASVKFSETFSALSHFSC